MGIIVDIQKPMIGVTSAIHKRRSAEVWFAQRGLPVVFAHPPRFTREPDILSPLGMPFKAYSFSLHPDIQRQVRVELALHGVLSFFAMDVNAYLGSGDPEHAKEAMLLTTCRGQGDSVVKAAETAEAIYDRHSGGVGRIYFDNLAASVQLGEDNRVMGWRGHLERARLSLSLPLVRLMADMRIWRKIVETSEAHTFGRPFDNAGATAGVDWSILPVYLDFISRVTGVRNLQMVWDHVNSGKRWVATENGVEAGMLPEMEEHLRAFRSTALRVITNL